ncbi:putative aminodeoxychorismate lyase [Saccharomonospora xinjiangensis]|nr:putative aminodeoxychorismate lyase [Saccharomonospora xinjiangensis]
MSVPHDGSDPRRRRPAQRPPQHQRRQPPPPQAPSPQEPAGTRQPPPRPPRPPRHAVSGENPLPPRRAPHAPRPAVVEPDLPPRHVREQGDLLDDGPAPYPPQAQPPQPPPPVRRAGRPPVRRRRPSPNDGVPADDNPTEILELDEPYDDLYDEEIEGDRRGYDDDYEYYDDDDGRGDGDDSRSGNGEPGDLREGRVRTGGEHDGDDFDEFDGFDDDDRAEPEYFADERDEEDAGTRREGRGRRSLKWVAALGLLALLGAGAYFGASELLGFGYEDYEGSGEADVILHVEEGDVTSAIAAKLAELDVVASPEAFVEAGEGDERVLGIQPGYYQVKTKMSGQAAVEALVDDDARVGHLQIKAGTKLFDVTQPDDSVTPGIFTLLADASCAQLGGKETCVSAEELRKTADTADLAELGVPDWAVADAGKAPKGRKLEGLIAPGVYDVKPGGGAKELLSQVLTASATRMEAAGLPSAAGSTPYSPYQVLVIASIVEMEGVKADFTKVSSVIYNRLEIDMRLEMDSTVNYPLERPTLTTKAQEREKQTPWNTYRMTGLPQTPIGAPSLDAVEAALNPEDTDFVYFVKCEKNGLSCFNVEYTDHQADRDDARARGVY